MVHFEHLFDARKSLIFNRVQFDQISRLFRVLERIDACKIEERAFRFLDLIVQRFEAGLEFGSALQLGKAFFRSGFLDIFLNDCIYDYLTRFGDATVHRHANKRTFFLFNGDGCRKHPRWVFGVVDPSQTTNVWLGGHALEQSPLGHLLHLGRQRGSEFPKDLPVTRSLEPE